MISSLLKKVFGSRNQRLLKQYQRTVVAINSLEAGISALSDDELRAKTVELRQRVAAGASLDQVLPEAFAVCREGGKRALGMRHFDVQLIGGMVLHYGKISEMRTGEGKTLVATLPAYLNALSGKGVHVVTVNDYLAKRDAEWMAKLYNFLGLSVGINLSQMEHDEKQSAYAADITYGTNNEFGFDYLRDNMVGAAAQRVQRPLNYAIVDEVDSILIDEARTPLIISGQADDNTDIYFRMKDVPARLVRQDKEDGPGDYWVDEKGHQVTLSEDGHEHVEQLLVQAGMLVAGESLYSPGNINLMHHLYAALRAHTLFLRDQHYVVQDDTIIIVDEFTGRMMPGRRWSDGLHQAVEAKEGVSINKESQTLASITLQNYFRMYTKLSGMTGTADTEAYEFQQIYGLETVVIPTNRPMRRKDDLDQVYRSAAEKYNAILADIKDCHHRGQPVLVGTTSIENSELLSEMLNRDKIPHQVLNAKQHAREAEIVAQAGRPGVITIATNMAGRGTDIVLGGNIEREVDSLVYADGASSADREQKITELRAAWQKIHDQVLEAGGLHIIGTERHESRRIDNQLRGRSGRQGDPGSSRFYLSLEDPLLRIFAGERVARIMDMLKMPEGEAIVHPMVSRSIENAQRKVEARNFDMRKQLLEYDDVANEQRKVIYRERNDLLESDGIEAAVIGMRHSVLSDLILAHMPAGTLEEQWDITGLEKTLATSFHVEQPIGQWLRSDHGLTAETIISRVCAASDEQYQAKVALASPAVMRDFERSIMLQVLDQHWREHLAALDHLRQGIHLRGYGQKNPKQEYKREAFELFSTMLDMIRRRITDIVVNVRVEKPEDLEEVEYHEPDNVQYHHADLDEALAEANAKAAEEAVAQPFTRLGAKVGRNDPCPCGSGVKYKQCHGKLS